MNIFWLIISALVAGVAQKAAIECGSCFTPIVKVSEGRTDATAWSSLLRYFLIKMTGKWHAPSSCIRYTATALAERSLTSSLGPPASSNPASPQRYHFTQPSFSTSCSPRIRAPPRYCLDLIALHDD